MAKTNTDRKIRYSAKYNWFDTGTSSQIERGNITIVGQAYANSEVTISYTGVDPVTGNTFDHQEKIVFS